MHWPSPPLQSHMNVYLTYQCCNETMQYYYAILGLGDNLSLHPWALPRVRFAIHPVPTRYQCLPTARSAGSVDRGPEGPRQQTTGASQTILYLLRSHIRTASHSSLSDYLLTSLAGSAYTSPPPPSLARSPGGAAAQKEKRSRDP